MRTIELEIEPLTAEAFREFGAVLELGSEPTFALPTKDITRFAFEHDAPVTMQVLSYKAQAFEVPRLEQHLNITEARFHIGGAPAVVVAAPPSDDLPDWSRLRAFRFDRQGAVFRTGMWHSLDAFPVGGDRSDFLFLSDRETQRELFDDPVAEPRRTRMVWLADSGLRLTFAAG